MADSYYILEQQREIYGLVYFFAFLFVVALAVYWRVYRIEWLAFDRKKKSIVIIRFTLFLLLLIVISFSTNADRRRYERIFKNGIITEGITIKKFWPSRGEPYIEFRFRVNNKAYTSSIGYCYEGEYISNIKVPNGRYRVIYNSENPEESIMDFKISMGDDIQ